jgi:antitoxin MazE
MKATIRKWGNSLAVRIPKAISEDADMREGAEIELFRTEEGLLLKPRRKPRYRLSELVEGITRKNVHPETVWGSSAGREMLE